jgi:hypothetical protein
MKQFILAALVLTVCATAWGTVPTMMSYQGIFNDAEGNVMPDGTYFIGFHIFAGPVGGPPLWSEWQEVEIVDGLFNVILGGTVPLFPGLFPRANAWFVISYDEEFLGPRQPFTSVPYAFRACMSAHADSLGDLTEAILNSRHSSLQGQINTLDARLDTVEAILDTILIGGDDCCCYIVTATASSITPWLATFETTYITMTGSFTLTNASNVRFSAQTGPATIPLEPYPELRFGVELLNAQTEQIVSSSRLTGGFAPMSLQSEYISHQVPAGTYKVRFFVQNLDWDPEDEDFPGYEGYYMSAMYQECVGVEATPTAR